MRPISFLAMIAIVSASHGQSTWSLSGKILDAEEGNGLGSVRVQLAQAGLETTTAKNGDWSLSDGVGVRKRTLQGQPKGSFLRLVDGQLLLRMDGIDLQGRRMEHAPTLPSSSQAAARGLEAIQDTLIFSREGFFEKRIPVTSSVVATRLDSLRRIRYEGWIDSSHSNGFQPDTLDAFPDTVRTITFRFTKAHWDSMMQTMTDSCGKFGGGKVSCSNGNLDMIESEAMIWVPVDLHTDGQVWKNVAIRLKGNASLRTAWTKGTYSLPFRINTDKFEDTYPEIKNQRFHGFKKVTFYTPDQDSSSIRSSIASEMFRESGVACPISVPVHLMLDRGDGKPLDIGIYEMTEVPDKPMLNRLFGNDSGNLYKPESNLAKFTESEWYDEDLVTDYSDVKALIATLAATNRTTDTAAWHRAMEQVIDVDGFLNWLAVNTAIYNWDTYGALGHNYFLFNDKGRFRWIAYDISFSFNLSMTFMSRTSIWYDGSTRVGGFSGEFPLIKNLLADETYCERYRSHMVRAIAPDGPAGVASFKEKLDRYSAMISDFPRALKEAQSLKNVMTTRVGEVQKSLEAKTCPIR